jgi:hypothetical protein
MNVADILAQVKRSFGDESAVQLTETDIFSYIDNAQKDIVLHNDNLLEEIALDNIVTGIKEYLFPSDLLLLRTVRAKISVDAVSYSHLKFYSLHNFDTMVDGWDGSEFQGVPAIYTAYGRKIFVFPEPQVDITDGLKILYSKMPLPITDVSTLLSVPDIYHTAIIDYCMQRATTMDEELEASAFHKAIFDDKVRLLSNRDQAGVEETYPRITVCEDDAW